MLKITPDTNTLVSATIAEGNEYRILKLAKEGKIKLVISLAILKEFKEVISRPKFGFSYESKENAVKQILTISEITATTKTVDEIKEDPTDNRILECAEEGKADYIVSGDKHLVKLGRYKNIKIIRSTEILEKISREE